MIFEVTLNLHRLTCMYKLSRGVWDYLHFLFSTVYKFSYVCVFSFIYNFTVVLEPSVLFKLSEVNINGYFLSFYY